jgi:hypothetical protein
MKRILVTILMVTGLITPVAANAALGASNLKFDSSNINAGQIVTVTFDVERQVDSNAKYGLAITFYSTRNSFSGVATLINGDYAKGFWQAKVTCPSDVYTGQFQPSIRILETKLNLTINRPFPVLNVNGKTVPTQPIIYVSNIKTDKYSYTPGENLLITFDTTINGVKTEDTTDPEVIIRDLRSGNFIRPSLPPYKPIVATGDYSIGKWNVKYPLPTNLFSSQVLIEIYTPRGPEYPANISKSSVFEIVSNIREIKISDIKLDKESYEAGSKVKVTFSTTTQDTNLNQLNQPFLIISDLENSDLSPEFSTSLISGTINSGQWSSEFIVPNYLKTGDYLLAFYNKAFSIREIGPTLKIRQNQNLSLETPLPSTYKLGSQSLDVKTKVNSGVSVMSNVVTPEVCALEGSKLSVKAAGKCQIDFEAAGNETWAQAKLSVAIDVYKEKTLSITCVKGKTVRKVSGVKPVCPVGFKKK